MLAGSNTVLNEVERSLQAQDKHAAALGDGGYTADRLYVVQVRDALKLRRIRDIARRTARKRAQPALANDFSFAYL